MEPIYVHSEYGKLKKVLLHRPGAETENLTPSTYVELLFDDAYFLPQAQKEHDAFAKILRDNGVEVIYLEDLVATVLSISKEIKDDFIERFIIEAGVDRESSLFHRVVNYFDTFKNNKELVVKMMAGVRFSELPNSEKKTLRELSQNELFALKPMPNLIFTRDPFSTINKGVSLHTMFFETRRRETLFGEYVFKHHPDYKTVELYYDRYQNTSIEGGDVMILSDKEIAVGMSQRTNSSSVEKLAHNIFNKKGTTIERIYAIDIPKGRSWMHLDTVFTQIDKNKFAIFSNYQFTIFKITKNEDGTHRIKKYKKSIDEIMGEVFKQKDVKLIHCGNGDPLISEREQWNDGSNVLAISPNVVVAYERNYVTNKALKEAGVKVFEIPSGELSRGRGGPRCMSMPLIREDVK
ncbi:MAG: arginine deiminase [Candidatus Hepatoplasma vulgare]|nr:MAG: arginine deiminase [Candidatus Hepatoplasma sp.]